MRPGRDARVTALLLAPAGLFLGAWFLLPLAQLFRLSLGGREGRSTPTARSSAASSTSACSSTPWSSPSS